MVTRWNHWMIPKYRTSSVRKWVKNLNASMTLWMTFKLPCHQPRRCSSLPAWTRVKPPWLNPNLRRLEVWKPQIRRWLRQFPLTCLKMVLGFHGYGNNRLLRTLVHAWDMLMGPLSFGKSMHQWFYIPIQQNRKNICPCILPIQDLDCVIIPSDDEGEAMDTPPDQKVSMEAIMAALQSLQLFGCLMQMLSEIVTSNVKSKILSWTYVFKYLRPKPQRSH